MREIHRQLCVLCKFPLDFSLHIRMKFAIISNDLCALYVHKFYFIIFSSRPPEMQRNVNLSFFMVNNETIQTRSWGEKLQYHLVVNKHKRVFIFMCPLWIPMQNIFLIFLLFLFSDCYHWLRIDRSIECSMRKFGKQYTL